MLFPTRGGASVFKLLSEKGIVESHVHGEANLAFQYVVEHFKAYGEMPTVDIIFGKKGIALDDPQDQLEFLADELLNRKLYSDLSISLSGAVQTLSAGDPRKALEDLETKIRLLRAELGTTKVRKIHEAASDALEFYTLVKEGKRGIPSPWPTIDDATMGWWPEDFILVAARQGVGKCVEASSVIVDPETGLPQTAESVFKRIQPEIVSWDNERGVVVSRISAHVDTGRKECLEISLNSGRSIIVTPEHPFLVPNGEGTQWLPADKLALLDVVGTPARMPLPKIPERMNPATLLLVAALLVVGGTTLVFSFETLREKAAEAIEQALIDLGFDWNVVQYPKFGINPSENWEGQYLYPIGLGMGLPFELYKLPEDQLRFFVAWLWVFVSDHVVRGGRGGRQSVGELQHLHLRLGIQTRVYQADGCWCLSLDPRTLGVWEDLPFPDFYVSGRVVEALIPEDWEAPQEENRTPGVVWDEVVSIRNVGVRKIYDFTVPETSCFVANDIVVHNTWFALVQAVHAWRHGKRVLFASTEMSQQAIGLRFLALHNKLSFRDVRSARLPDTSEAKLVNSLSNLKDCETFSIVGGDFDFRPEALEAAIQECSPDLVIVDGAYLLKTQGHNRTEQAANAFNELKRIAKRCKVALMATTQFNREVRSGDAKAAKIESIGLTDVAGWNADAAFALMQTEEQKLSRTLTVVPLKLREGVCDVVHLNWNFETMNFSEESSVVTEITDPQSTDPDPFSQGGASSGGAVSLGSALATVADTDLANPQEYDF